MVIQNWPSTVPPDYPLALGTARDYLYILHPSRQWLYEMLTSETGTQFSPEAAQYALDHLEADYNANALVTAKSYQKMWSMAPEAIRDQLTSQYGEEFTPDEADYAIQHLND